MKCTLVGGFYFFKAARVVVLVLHHGRPQTSLLCNLFEYVQQAGDYGQIIILNNTVTPTSHFVYDNSTERIFGEHSEANHKGLLNDLREENADEQDLDQFKDILI